MRMHPTDVQLQGIEILYRPILGDMVKHQTLCRLPRSLGCIYLTFLPSFLHLETNLHHSLMAPNQPFPAFSPLSLLGIVPNKILNVLS